MTELAEQEMIPDEEEQNQELAPKLKDMPLMEILKSDLFKEQVLAALPSLLTPERFLRVSQTTINKNDKLKKCDKLSFFNALLTCAQAGLEPDGRLAHLIPYENKKKGIVECQVIFDYKGLAVLIMRAGRTSYLHADVVCQNDEFDFNMGHITRHRINFKEPRGDVYAVYTVCKMKDGAEKHEVMSLEEVNKIRARSKSPNSGPWVTDYNEMAKKTCFRRMVKLIDWSPEIKNVIEADDKQSFEYIERRPPSNVSAREQLMSAVIDARLDKETGEIKV